jgi:Arm DNA-binding domain
MRTVNRLTSNKVKNAKPGLEGRTVLLCDGGGLWLQVGLGKDKQVTKSWIFRYAAAGTKVSKTGREYRRERQMGLGPLHTVGVAEAREMARQARLLVQQGKPDRRAQRIQGRCCGRAGEAGDVRPGRGGLPAEVRGRMEEL